MENLSRPARLALALLLAAQVGGAPTVAIKSFRFRYAGAPIASGSSIEGAGSGIFELGVYSTTGQPATNVGWRIKTANGSFDSGLQTVTSVVAGPGQWNELNQVWPMANGTHRFVATVTPLGKASLLALTSGGRELSAEFTLTVRLITVQKLQIGMIAIPRVALATTRLENPSGHGHCTSNPPTIGAETVEMVVQSGPPTPPGFTGCALIAELFRGVKIGNGWTVQEATVTTMSENRPIWEVKPSGTSLAGRLRVPVKPAHPFGHAKVQITLKGSQGTQPTFTFDPLRIR